MIVTRLMTLTVLLMFCLVFTPGWAAPFDLIVCGSGGEARYESQFADWGDRLRHTMIEVLRHPRRNVRLLTESGTDADGQSSLETIRGTLQEFADIMQPEDDLFIYLVGHGSFRRQVAKLNIPGPDLSADELDALLRGITVRQTVVVNGASASAAFINALSGKGRIICTSTKSADERYATMFIEHFIQALEEGSADQDRDGRISVFETCQQAASLTEAWYVGEGLLATEHALLDDNADGLGSRLDVAGSRQEKQEAPVDGERARVCFLLDFQFPLGAPPELVQAYRTAQEDVESMLRHKADMEPDAYYQELEMLLLRAARLHRRIREVVSSEDLD